MTMCKPKSSHMTHHHDNRVGGSDNHVGGLEEGTSPLDKATAGNLGSRGIEIARA